jgi:hypothetical protein
MVRIMKFLVDDLLSSREIKVQVDINEVMELEIKK